MVGTRHAHLHTLPGQRLGDAQVVHRHHHLHGTSLQRPLRHARHHRHAVDGTQRLGRQAGGAIASRNGDDEGKIRHDDLGNQGAKPTLPPRNKVGAHPVRDVLALANPAKAIVHRVRSYMGSMAKPQVLASSL
jgi:hypothetical protein